MADLTRIDGEIIGSLSSLDALSGTLTNTLTLSGTLTPGTFSKDYPVYTGMYEIIPLVDLDILLETANKRLQDNIIVRKIPYSETLNESGGYTVIIG